MEVAAGMTAFNPLRCSGTALPPQLLLVAKLIVFGLLLKGLVQPIPGIPVIEVTFSLLVFVEWPNAGEIEIVKAPSQGAGRTILNLAQRLDIDHVLRFVTAEDAPQGKAGDSLRVQWRDQTYTDLGAVRRIALSLPVSYFLAALALIAPSLYLRWMGP